MMDSGRPYTEGTLKIHVEGRSGGVPHKEKLGPWGVKEGPSTSERDF